MGPEPSDDATGALLGLLNNFEGKVNKYIEGQRDHEYYLRAINQHYKDFKQKLRQSQPEFVPTVRPVPAGSKKTGEEALEEAINDPKAKL